MAADAHKGYSSGSLYENRIPPGLSVVRKTNPIRIPSTFDPMNKGVTSAKAACLPNASGSAPLSAQMLTELVALNEEMSMQLRVERTYTAGITDFITVMIEQHETTAARLRAHLRTHQDAFAKPLTC
jgi:hypothetical protein